jgi:hypothetical protein
MRLADRIHRGSRAGAALLEGRSQQPHERKRAFRVGGTRRNRSSAPWWSSRSPWPSCS